MKPFALNLKAYPWLPFFLGSFFILLLSSLSRHFLFQSNALDLGWFDQAVYLISQGKSPIVSFSGFHILGDHAAFIYYFIALFYKIYPSIIWLLIIQAIALSIGVIPLYQLSLQAGLKQSQAVNIMWVYLLYPLIFNVNLFDFHSEVIALPALLWAVYTARCQHLWGFIGSVIVVLSCKAVLSLTVSAMGLWLFFFEKKRVLGLLALGLGTFWFLFSTQVIIPLFSGAEAAAVNRYEFLGHSVLEIMTNVILKPQIILSHLFTGANLEYLVFLLIPLIWGLSPRYLSPLIAALPALGLNLITEYRPQKDLVHQYSLPILPFLLLIVIVTIANQKAWLKQRWQILLWATIAFLAFAKYGYFTSRYLEQIDTLSAMREAVNLVSPQESVLTTAQIAPHLTHRSLIHIAIKDQTPFNLNQYQVILLNQKYPSWPDSEQTVRDLVQQLQSLDSFDLPYQKDDVFLFRQR